MTFEECPTCFSTDGDCGCDSWQRYWESLTPEERAAEMRSIAQHVEETS